MEERLIELEMKAAFQDEMIEKLNQVIIRQQDQIDQLSLRLEKLTDLVEQSAPDMTDDSPPPHY